MKKLLVALGLAVATTTVSAHGWVGPFIAGAVVGNVVTEVNRRPYYPPPVVYYPAPVYGTYPYPYYGPNPYATNPMAGYHHERYFDYNCQCFRLILVPNQ